MPAQQTLSDLLGTSADAPRRHVNADGAVVAMTYTQEQWDGLSEKAKVDRNGHRSVVTRCPVRGIVSVEAFVVPDASAAAPKPWSRAAPRPVAGLEPRDRLAA